MPKQCGCRLPGVGPGPISAGPAAHQRVQQQGTVSSSRGSSTRRAERGCYHGGGVRPSGRPSRRGAAAAGRQRVRCLALRSPAPGPACWSACLLACLLARTTAGSGPRHAYPTAHSHLHCAAAASRPGWWAWRGCPAAARAAWCRRCARGSMRAARRPWWSPWMVRLLTAAGGAAVAPC